MTCGRSNSAYKINNITSFADYFLDEQLAMDDLTPKLPYAFQQTRRSKPSEHHASAGNRGVEVVGLLGSSEHPSHGWYG